MELARKKLVKCLQGSTAVQAMAAVEDWLIAVESSDLVVWEWIGGKKKEKQRMIFSMGWVARIHALEEGSEAR